MSEKMLSAGKGALFLTALSAISQLLAKISFLIPALQQYDFPLPYIGTNTGNRRHAARYTASVFLAPKCYHSFYHILSESFSSVSYIFS